MLPPDVARGARQSRGEGTVAFITASARSDWENGFDSRGSWPSAPGGSSAYPVARMIGTSGRRPRISAESCAPVMCGMAWSVMTRSNRTRLTSSSASLPE